MSLNLWQIHNDALHADQIMTDYNTQCRLLQTQTATWYDKEKEFEAEDRSTDPNHILQAWCMTIERVHRMNEHIRETTNGRDIRAFFPSTHTHNSPRLARKGVGMRRDGMEPESF